MKLSYVPLQNNQFHSLTWGTEVLFSDNRYLADPNGIPSSGDEFDENVGSVGLYSYVTYKWSRQWSAGFLFDWVQSDQNNSRSDLPPIRLTSPWPSATGTNCGCNTPTPTTTPPPACNPMTPSICNGPGSSARIRMAGNNAKP